MRQGSESDIPGIYFQREPLRPNSELPRMDVAAFVGFAEKGPLHTPVTVETVAQFRDVFGDDVPLAWNEQRQRMQYSLLGGSVDAFFANGGNRCEVVRVADTADPEPGVLVSRRFPLTGVYSFEAIETDWQQAELSTRSSGTWGDGLRVGTGLETRLLPFARDEKVVERAASDWYRIAVRSVPADLGLGDLLRVDWHRAALTAFVFVERIVDDSRGMRVESAEVYWFDSAAHGLPTRLDESEGWARAQEELSLSPVSQMSIALLTLTLGVWDGETMTHQITRLRFHGEHPRFWQKLPGDYLLYNELVEAGIEEFGNDAFQFVAETRQPRFPLGGRFQSRRQQLTETLNQRSLPLTVHGSLDVSRASPPIPLTPSEAALSPAERNGLHAFRAELFLDVPLARLQTRSLSTEANFRKIHFRELLGGKSALDDASFTSRLHELSLKGVHSLYYRDAVSMIAVPDAVHRSWHNNAPPPQDSLDSPELARPEFSREGQWIEVRWPIIPGASGYVLEHVRHPEDSGGTRHRIPAVQTAGEDALLMVTHRVAVDPSRETQHEFRVFAVDRSQRSVWSRTRTLGLPERDFHRCGSLIASRLEVTLEVAGVTDDGRVQLIWHCADEGRESLALADGVQLQRSLDIDFTDPIEWNVSEFGSPPTYIDGPDGLIADATVYYRLRALADSTVGPWSNTVILQPYRLNKLVLQSPEDYRPHALIAVHTAVMRCCAARGDAAALLALPEHYHESDVVSIAQDLRGTQRRTDLVNASGVPPLNLSERAALSYAALLHPWLTVSLSISPSTAAAGAPDTSVARNQPALGSVCGKLALTANRGGAWLSVANVPLASALGLVGTSVGEALADLYHVQVSALAQVPRGFVLVSLDTLSRDKEFRSFNVRRLFNLLTRLVRREGSRYVFEPNDTEFRNRVHHQWDRLLTGLYQRGALRGRNADEAYRVVTNSALNTPGTRAQGKVFIELRVAPSRPLRFIRVLLKQTGDANIALEEM